MMTVNVNSGVVSTIIPVFNRPEMLRRAVESVLSQTYKSIEIIIVDDGSTDNTLSVANALRHEHSAIRVLSIENSGPGAAREAGRLNATGEFVQYLDSDDILLPEKFTKQVGKLNQNPKCDVCYCQTSLQRLDGSVVTPWKRTGEKIDQIIPAMLASRWWDTSTPLYTRRVVELAGPWHTWINEEDWEYDCRIGFNSTGLAYVPDILSVQMEHQEARLSHDGARDQQKLKSRVNARMAIIGQSLNAPPATESSEFVTQLKYSFLLSRQAGAAGLADESRDLFNLVQPHLKSRNISVLGMTLYKLGAQLIGWQAMGKLSEQIDKLRK
ncbi:glycosyltransferase family 2 protein [Arenicella xantha]|uniref:Glycosyl transferase family 2 n=1 Tax=Arenicella xantha TaxID=644221 RepID=A0A395JJV0_9GAMM|nr:glycosyltransferase family A protein [Arenicella xantha]RBP49172.1 glycosyl transferase family 2 [Arenicella xantha]